MDERFKELIAVGASVSANCHPCLKYHVAKARECGAEDREISDAIGVGRMVSKGARGQMDKLASTILEEIPSCAGEAPEGCSGS